MKSTVASLFLALAATTAGSPSTDPSTITFRLTNYNGASPPIDEPYPPNRNVLVSTSEGAHSFLGVSNDVAHGLATINNG
ncbi:hypothetical protein N7493_011763 [Penicillium malachiteum]|uniref:Uncharacterized protein n=1 Tax=Penicillium malachiteum TaxID=1324776 RepID=A0AAD6HAH5_9EURO|nr:hypothetical protein N7493_011763 [Penicillium malachiteum]